MAPCADVNSPPVETAPNPRAEPVVLGHEEKEEWCSTPDSVSENGMRVSQSPDAFHQQMLWLCREPVLLRMRGHNSQTGGSHAAEKPSLARGIQASDTRHSW